MANTQQNTQQQATGARSGKELAMLVGVLLMVAAGMIATYWVGFSGMEEARAKPGAVATAPAAAPTHSGVVLSAPPGLEAGRRGKHYTRVCRRCGRRGRDGARLGPGLLHAAETNPVGRDHSGGDHQEHPDEHRQLLPTSCPGRLLLRVLLCVGHGCFLLGEGDRATREPRRLGKMERMVSLTCPWNAGA